MIILVIYEVAEIVQKSSTKLLQKKTAADNSVLWFLTGQGYSVTDWHRTKKAAVHQLTTMLSTSKNVLYLEVLTTC